MKKKLEKGKKIHADGVGLGEFPKGDFLLAFHFRYSLFLVSFLGVHIPQGCAGGVLGEARECLFILFALDHNNSRGEKLEPKAPGRINDKRRRRRTASRSLRFVACWKKHARLCIEVKAADREEKPVCCSQRIVSMIACAIANHLPTYIPTYFTYEGISLLLFFIDSIRLMCFL